MRLEGMRFIRPERSWRPIVTVEIDKHSSYETILGVDGQNINQKETFSLCVVVSPFQLKVSSLFSSVIMQRLRLCFKSTFGNVHKVKRSPKGETS